MKEKELQFDRRVHVVYTKPCKKEIQKKIALHYPPAQREKVWEKVQLQYTAYLSRWRTDLGGKESRRIWERFRFCRHSSVFGSGCCFCWRWTI